MKVREFVLDHFLLLPIGALVALVWANSQPESYFRTSHALAFAVNQVGMALFVALITQEVVEATMRGGALHSWRRWGLPLIAAAGGIAGSALVYQLYVRLDTAPVFAVGWPAATAIDLVFAYFVVRSIFHRHPAVPFLVLAAVATTAFGLLVVSMTHATVTIGTGGALSMAAAIGLAAVMRWRHVHAFWPYLVFCGPFSWSALYASGIHPVLALVPIVPFLPHKPRGMAHFADTPDGPPASPRHFEHVWHYWVQAVLFLFGLVNAGVIVSHYGAGTWALVAAALAGRPIGMLAGVAVALAAGLRLPARMHWRDVVVISLAASTGFTFALFFATSLYAVGPLLAQVRIGALLTTAGVGLAYVVARMLRVGRFGTHRIVRAPRAPAVIHGVGVK